MAGTLTRSRLHHLLPGDLHRLLDRCALGVHLRHLCLIVRLAVSAALSWREPVAVALMRDHVHQRRPRNLYRVPDRRVLSAHLRQHHTTESVAVSAVTNWRVLVAGAPEHGRVYQGLPQDLQRLPD